VFGVGVTCGWEGAGFLLTGICLCRGVHRRGWLASGQQIGRRRPQGSRQLGEGVEQDLLPPLFDVGERRPGEADQFRERLLGDVLR